MSTPESASVRGWRRHLCNDPTRLWIAFPVSALLSGVVVMTVLPSDALLTALQGHGVGSIAPLVSIVLLAWGISCVVLALFGAVAFSGNRPLGPRLAVTPITTEGQWRALLGFSLREGPGAATQMAFAAVLASLGVVALGDAIDLTVILGTALAIGGSWLYVWVSFAIHYARMDHEHPGSIRFVDDSPRQFSDYLYMSLMVQCTFGPTDATLATTEARRTGMIHSLGAFAVNTIAVAVLVSVLVSNLG